MKCLSPKEVVVKKKKLLSTAIFAVAFLRVPTQVMKEKAKYRADIIPVLYLLIFKSKMTT